MKALLYNPKETQTAYLSLDEINKPSLNNNNAIVKVTGVGVCGSDLLKLDRGLIKEKTILGHELVGIIEEISPQMTEIYGFKKGDRIISSHHVPCLNCSYCLNKQESLCQSFKESNFKPGAFCEYLELSERHLQYTVKKAPDHLSDEEASFTEPLACCIKAIERSKLKERKGNFSVLVLGLGSIGLMLGQLIKHYNNSCKLVGADLLDERLTLANELGFNTSCKTIAEDKSFDFVFLCAGAASTVDLALKHAANGATILVFSSTASPALFTNNDIYYKELTVLGSYSPNLKNLDESLDLISKGKIKVDQLISHRSDLDNLGACIRKAQEEKGLKSFMSLRAKRSNPIQE